MLIQNTGNMAQAPQPVRLSSDGGPSATVVPAASNAGTKPSAAVELPQAAVKQVAEQRVSSDQLKSAVESINRALKQANRNLEFTVDQETEKQVVKLVETDTGDVVRQFPSEEMLAISRSIKQFQQGLLLRQEA